MKTTISVSVDCNILTKINMLVPLRKRSELIENLLAKYAMEKLKDFEENGKDKEKLEEEEKEIIAKLQKIQDKKKYIEEQEKKKQEEQKQITVLYDSEME